MEPQHPESTRKPLGPEDFIEINKLVQPMRKIPQWALGIGIGFGLIVPLFVYLFDGPMMIGIVAFVMGSAFGVLGYWATKNMLGKIAEDLKVGHKIEVIGLLEDARVKTQGKSSSSSYYWTIGGKEFVVTKEMYGNALPGYTVRLCYLPTSALTYLAVRH
jgi:hypothetical protein